MFGKAEELGSSSGINPGAAAASHRPHRGCPTLPRAPAPAGSQSALVPLGTRGFQGPVILLMTLEKCLPALEGAELMKSAQAWPGCD